MRWFLRVSLAVVAGSSGCVGGPVSDWPAKGHDDDGENTSSDPKAPPPSSNSGGRGAMDGGLAASPVDDGAETGADAGVDGGAACDANPSACDASCLDAGASPPVDPTARARLGCAEAPAAHGLK